MNSVKPVVVFLGPSLPREEASRILDADYRPPARMGDIHRALTFGVKTIVLIDGLFQGVPSIWHREILDALEEGVKVLGASSMGALRAAELHRFGMEGRGTVFEWYRDGLVNGDDEVAMIHGPEETGYRSLSEPLVNIRATMSRAVEANCISSAQAQQVLQYAKQLYYPERSYSRLLNSPIVEDWPEEQRHRFTRHVEQERVDVKRRDAIDVLQYCSQFNGMPKMDLGVNHRKPMDMKWELGPVLRARLLGKRGEVTGMQVLEEVQKDTQRALAMWAELSRRHFILQWAEQNQVNCPPDFLNTFSQRWRKDHGIDDHGSWLRANGLMLGTYRRLVGECALIEWISEQSPSDFGAECKFREDSREARARCYVLAWMQQNGIYPPSEAMDRGSCGDEISSPGSPCRHADVEMDTDTDDMAAWAERQGPLYFGHPWSFEVAWLRELQITGQAAEIAASLIDEDR